MEADTASTLEPSRTYQKHFIPLESNPEIFTALIHKLGVSESLEFQDVLSLDDPDLLAFLPRPVHALILVFLTSEQYEARVTEEDSGLEEGQPHGDVLFFKQTINNACGLYAILHAVCNGEARCKISMAAVCITLKSAANLPFSLGVYSRQSSTERDIT
jgi:ubiquitin carboxyl-terminal hydrolase L3